MFIPKNYLVNGKKKSDIKDFVNRNNSQKIQRQNNLARLLKKKKNKKKHLNR